MKVTGKLDVLGGKLYYLIVHPLKYPINTEAVLLKRLTPEDKGKTYTGELSETLKRITRIY